MPKTSFRKNSGTIAYLRREASRRQRLGPVRGGHQGRTEASQGRVGLQGADVVDLARRGWQLRIDLGVAGCCCGSRTGSGHKPQGVRAQARPTARKRRMIKLCALGGESPTFGGVRAHVGTWADASELRPHFQTLSLCHRYPNYGNFSRVTIWLQEGSQLSKRPRAGAIDNRLGKRLRGLRNRSTGNGRAGTTASSAPSDINSGRQKATDLFSDAQFT